MLRFLKDGSPIFMSRLTEDSVYYIKYFQVCNARPNYLPVDYPYMAHFTTHTQIHQVKTVPAHFPQYAYNLSTSEELHQRCGITEHCSGDKYITIFLCSHNMRFSYRCHRYFHWMLPCKAAANQQGNQATTKCNIN